MDDALSALVARFPRLAWRREGDHYEGQRDQIVVTVWDDGGDLDAWRAFGVADGIRVATRSGTAIGAVEKLAKEPDFADALSAAPAEPEEWGDSNMPGPAALGCPVAWGLLCVLLALGGGVVCLGFWSGGVQW